MPREHFVVFVQNHDQVGNRARGERLSTLVDLEECKLAATALLLSPYVPLLFMGEEYGERAPFLFFADFQDAELQGAVSRGRREEFATFGWIGDVPDPQSPTSFCRSKLNWGLQASTPHAWLWDYYRELLELRRRYPVLGVGGKRRLRAHLNGERLLVLLRKDPDGTAAVGLLNVGPEGRVARVGLPPGEWRRVVDSGEVRFGGFGPKTPECVSLPRRAQTQIDMAPWGAAVFVRAGRTPMS
jgi:maltooligosyltrehalose trehalohydrolase